MLREFSQRLNAIRFETLPQQTVEKTKTAIINFFAGSLPGATAPLTQAVKRMWMAQRDVAIANVLGDSKQLSAIGAGAVNAAMGEIYLQEDMHTATQSHPGMLVVPVVMAVGQSVNATGKQIIEAIVTGYESMCRVGRALLVPHFSRNGLRPASILAPFGGAAGAARLLRSSDECMVNALAIAGNTASGVMEFVNAGTEDICIQNCFAAQSSIMAALLAADGVKASASILEGQYGLGKALAGGHSDWKKLVEGFGDSYEIDSTFIKPFPACAFVQGTAQAITALTTHNDIDPQQVEEIIIGVYSGAKTWPGVDNQGPFGGVISAMMSHQFMVASAIVQGEISVKTVKMYDHPDVLRMAKRATVVLDDEIDKAFPSKKGGRVCVALRDGRRLINYQPDVAGLSRDGAIQRLRHNAQGILTSEMVEALINKASTLEALVSVNDLMAAASSVDRRA